MIFSRASALPGEGRFVCSVRRHLNGIYTVSRLCCKMKLPVYLFVPALDLGKKPLSPLASTTSTQNKICTLFFLEIKLKCFPASTTSTRCEQPAPTLHLPVNFLSTSKVGMVPAGKRGMYVYDSGASPCGTSATRSWLCFFFALHISATRDRLML